MAHPLRWSRAAITAERLATLLTEEFEKEDWGDIDPYWFTCACFPPDFDQDNYEDVEALRGILQRVAWRLNDEEENA
jgi:hypothetical protein